MAPSFADVIKSQYVSLTTFTKDGRPKPTAIWIAADGDRALVITGGDSWKVKRIRNTPRVTIAECDRTGKVKGEPVEAVATILEDAHIETVYAAIGNRCGCSERCSTSSRSCAAGPSATSVWNCGRPDVAATFAEVAQAKYLLLTTFTKDGRPKPTAIWGVPDGDKLLVITDDGSWKVKRIRNTPRVTIAPCGVLGKPKGEPVEAVARVLPSRRLAPSTTRCCVGTGTTPGGSTCTRSSAAGSTRCTSVSR